jgi:alkylation response protein AidB-like acyl-CoA dehydrogenase
MTTASAPDWKQILAALGPAFAERAATYDGSDGFVAENYAEMRAAKLFSALVPQELGGGGLSYSDVLQSHSRRWLLLRLHGAGVFDAPAFDRHRAMELPPRQTW